MKMKKNHGLKIFKIQHIKCHGVNLTINPNLSEEDKLSVVRKNGFYLEYIENPSEMVQMAAVSRYGKAIKYIKNPSEKVKLAAAKQTERASEYGLRSFKSSINYAGIDIGGPTEEEKRWASEYRCPTEPVKSVANYWRAFKKIKNPFKLAQWFTLS